MNTRYIDYCYRLAQQHLDTVEPVPLAPTPSPCELGGTQATTKEPAGPPVDWATDSRQSCDLNDQEVLDKMHWQLRAINTCERLQRAFEVPIVYPEAK
jgi:hypothetical protein